MHDYDASTCNTNWGESPSRFVSLEGDCQHGGVSPQSNPREPQVELEAQRQWGPLHLAIVDNAQKSRLNTYEHALSACRICATIEDEPVETLSLAQTWHWCILDLVCYNSTTNYCRKGHATGFIRMPSLQRLKVKLAECSGGVITNESPCDAYSSELTLPVNANA